MTILFSILINLGPSLPWGEPCAASGLDSSSSDASSAPAAAVSARSPEAAREYALLNWGAARRSVCGINALYLWLRLLDQPVSMTDLESDLGLSPLGHPMSALRDAARERGLGCDVFHYRSADELRRARLPALAFGSQRHRRSGVFVGHFLVVLEQSGGRVRYLDPTTGREHRSDEQRFMTQTTGHLLELQPAPAWASPRAWTFGLGSAGLVALVLLLGSTGWRRARSGAVALVFAASVGTAAAENWRSEGRDARNALELLAGQYGASLEAPDLDGRLREGASLAELRDVATDSGFALEIVRSEPFAAMAGSLPAIAHLRSTRLGNGGFVVVQSAGARGVALFTGSGLQFTEMDWEDFLDEWSGHLLVPRREAPEPGLPIVLGLAAALFLYAMWRLR